MKEKSAWLSMTPAPKKLTALEKAEELKRKMYKPEGLDVTTADQYQQLRDQLLWENYINKMRNARGI